MGIYGKTAATIDLAAISATMQKSVDDWYNATIQILDPHIDAGTFNRATNTKERPAPTVLWEGPGRIQAVRWPNVATSRQEAVSLRTVVFHIPLDTNLDPGLIVEGFRVRVIDGGLGPEFEHGLFVITATTNSSFAWDRRIETIMDQGAVIS